MGGPPLVAPNRVKAGGADKNEEEMRETWLTEIAPRPAGINTMMNLKENRSLVITHAACNYNCI